MYSKWDNPNYRPIPSEREKDRLRSLYLEYQALDRKLAAVRQEIMELEAKPYVLDTPLPEE